MIEEHPSSLLITVNETGDFSCRASCVSPCLGHWVINGESTEFNDLRSKFTDKGFIFPGSNPTKYGNEYVLKLSVKASEANNNSTIHCDYQLFDSPFNTEQSKTARMLVISSK